MGFDEGNGCTALKSVEHYEMTSGGSIVKKIVLTYGYDVTFAFANIA
jgi:hypothetical protein